MLLTKKHTVKNYNTNSNAPYDYPNFIHPITLTITKNKIEHNIMLDNSNNKKTIITNRVKNIRYNLY
jgi:Ribose 5-phosphate isomerase RpiB